MTDKHVVTYWHDLAKTQGPFTAEFTDKEAADKFAGEVIADNGEVNTSDEPGTPDVTPAPDGSLGFASGDTTPPAPDGSLGFASGDTTPPTADSTPVV